MRLALILVALVACKKEPAMSVEQYEAMNTKLTTDVTAVFVAGGTDCKKLATDLGAFMTAHDGEMTQIVAWEQSHAKEKASYDSRTGNKLLEEFGQKASAGLGACESDPTFKPVWDRFTKD